MRIAVFTDENSNICDFFNARRFIIWEKSGAGWRESDKKNFLQIKPTTPAQTRKDMEAILQLTDDCEIIAGGALTGIPYVVLDQAGKHIFQIDAIDDEILDSMVSDIFAEPEPHVCNASACNVPCSAQVAVKAPAPEEISPGIYQFDLVALQRTSPQISSKQALRGFMEATPFTELHLVCAHIPPWIEKDYNVRQEGISCKITPK